MYKTIYLKVNSEFMKLSGGDLLMRALKDEGVQFIFGYPGGAWYIYDSFLNKRLLNIF